MVGEGLVCRGRKRDGKVIWVVGNIEEVIPGLNHIRIPFFPPRIADFGFARYLTGADMAATLCGSPLYMVIP